MSDVEQIKKIMGGDFSAYQEYHQSLFSDDDNMGFSIITWMFEYFRKLGRPDDCKTREDACLFLTMTALLHAREVLGVQSGELPSEEDWSQIHGMAPKFEEALDDWLSDGYSNDQSLFATFVTMWLAFYDVYKKVPMGAVESVANKLRSFLTAHDVASGEKPGHKVGERWDLLREFQESLHKRGVESGDSPFEMGLIFSPSQCAFSVHGEMTRGEWLKGMMTYIQGDC